MNGAWTYKQTVTEKKTYIIAFSLALLLFIALGGAHKGYEDQMHLIQLHQAEEDSIRNEKITEEKSHISSKVPYQTFFQEFAPQIGWEWEMLAALAWNESHFNPQAQSPRGACGLMQLMPRTGANYGLNDSTIFIPRENIRASIQVLSRLNRMFQNVADSTERIKFVLSSYNAGTAHILDARALAEKYGADPNKWDDVYHYLTLLKEEQYYTDSVVKYGSFKSGETLRYADAILGTYTKIKHGKLKVYNNQVIVPKDQPTQNISAETSPTDSLTAPAETEPIDNERISEEESPAIKEHPATE